ncbi:SusC/RagA family TonB-linked outer membrane protein [Pedobacter alpinus]|uniref:SusC/RagA family TonB-linked outer membrane protein n=1 Tax=Pedobacter alpinus TaxID=1590643 RepID=A0ABW5TXN9_9SPHI
MKFKTYISIMAYGFVFLLCFAAKQSIAQTKIKVQGIVKSVEGEPLPGVSVSIKDTKTGTTTDLNGQFTISTEPGKILVFNYLGFKTLAKGVTDQKVMNVTLEIERSLMDEVVVIGYGTQRKSSVTGAVSKLVNTNLDEIPTSRLDNALIGKIAGVSIQNVTSEVGADPVIRVRGFGSISANSSPLVVVDGYPVPDGLSFVNPQDVESIEVLKDAASAAIYGSRGANGVILITTKQGVADKPRYSVKTFSGIRESYALNPIMSITEYAQGLYREAALREQDPSVPVNSRNLITPNERAMYVIENQIFGQPTNWQDVGLRNNPIINNAQLSISGGKKDLKYFISGNITQDQGVMKFSDNTRASFRTRLSGDLSKKIKFNININPSYNGTTRPAANYTDYFRFFSFLPERHNDFTTAFVRQNPQWAGINTGDYAQARHFSGLNYSGMMPDGSLWTSSGTVIPWSTNNNSPISIADRQDITRTQYRMLGSGDLSYEIIPKLILKTSIGGYYTNQDDLDFTLSNARQDGAVNEADIRNRVFKDILWENTLNYNFTKKDHSFGFLAGFTTQQTFTNSSRYVGRDYPADQLNTQPSQIDLALSVPFQDRVGLISYLGRFNYDYKSKYLFQTSFRTDGSSNFAPGRKWGYFPSVSLGWVASNEDFLKDARWLSNLKLRSSYGATGNNRINSFAFTNLLYPSNYSFGGGTGSLGLGLSPNGTVLANPNITWERTFAYNTGLDLSVLNNRFGLTVEYYSSTTDRLLYNQAVPAITGSNEYVNNVGKVRNRGLEFEITSNNYRSKNFEWSTSANISANRNTLLALGGEPFQNNFGERNEIYSAVVGKQAIQYLGFKTDGIWTSQTQIDEARAAGQSSLLARYYTPGGLKFVDVNADGIIDNNDRTTIGSPFPDFLWGVTNTLKYKSFDLSVSIQGSQGGQLVNGDYNYLETKRLNKNFNNENRWISEQFPGDGKTPYNDFGFNGMLTDFVVEDASYASIRNVIIGYGLPTKFTKKAKISNMRVYASAENLLYFMGKNYRGINPEARTTSSAYASPLIDGYQRGAFPIMRTITFGLDFTF